MLNPLTDTLIFINHRTETHGDPTSVDGSTTAEQSIRGPALPWEQSVQNQG